MARKINDSIDLAYNELQNVTLQNLSADPGAGLGDGRIWYDTVLDAVRVRANGATVSLASGMDSEAVQDIVGAMTVGGTESGITVSYDDTNARLDFTVTDSPLLGGQTSAYHLARANHTGTQTASTISDFTSVATEVAQDVAGTIVGAGGIVVTYDDAGTGLTTLTLTNNEAFQDAVGPFFASGTGSSGITVTYDDAGGDMNYVVTDSPLLGGQTSAYHLARANHTGTQLFSTVTTTNTDKLLGRDTAAGGAVEEIAVSGGIEFTGATGIQTSAFTGDVTKAAGGTALTIATDAVVTAKILNANVTLAKMANITTDSLIGRDTAATGVPEVITLDTTLAMNGSQVLGRAALTGDVTASANSNATAIASNAVVTAKILDANVTLAKMANITTDSLIGRDTAATGVPEVITLGASLSMNGSQVLQRAALTGDVTAPVNSNATTISAGVVTNAMHSNMNAHTIKGNNTAGATAPIDLTLAQVKTELAYNGTEIVFTPAGNIAATNVSAAISELETDMTALIASTVEAKVWKDPVDAATTAALPALTYSAGAGTLTETGNGALPAQDGVTLIVNEELLVKDQASTFQNGIYVVTVVGTAGTPFVLTRRADANTAAELRDAAVMIEGGTTLGGDIYTQTVSTLADLTGAAQTWTKTGDTNTVYTADGTTLELIGNSFRIKATAAGSGLTGGGGAALDVNTGAGLEISSDAVRIAAAAAGGGLTGGAGSALAVGQGTGITVNADDVAVNHAVVPMLYAVTLTGGATSEVVTHSLGTRDVQVGVYLVGGTFAEEEFSVEHTSTTTITVRSAITIPAATYRCVVFG